MLDYRTPGVTRDHHRDYAQLIDEEKQLDGFTYCVIENIRPQWLSELENPSRLLETLAHIYHYYLHGPGGNLGGFSKVKRRPHIRLVYHDGAEEFDLANIDTDRETELLRSASSEPHFEFAIKLADKLSVEGQLRYHPLVNGEETYPLEVNASPNAVQAQDDEDIIAADFVDRSHNIFSVFWNGRYLPNASVKDLPFCGYGHKRVESLQVYHRLSGTLWLSNDFMPANNKATIIEKLTSKLATKDMTITLGNRTYSKKEPVALSTMFVDWVELCERTLDREIQLFEPSQDLVGVDQERTAFRVITYTHVQVEGHKQKQVDMTAERGSYLHFKDTTGEERVFEIINFLAKGDLRDANAVCLSKASVRRTLILQYRDVTLQDPDDDDNDDIEEGKCIQLLTVKKPTIVKPAKIKAVLQGVRERLDLTLDLTSTTPGFLQKGALFAGSDANVFVKAYNKRDGQEKPVSAAVRKRLNIEYQLACRPLLTQDAPSMNKQSFEAYAHEIEGVMDHTFDGEWQEMKVELVEWTGSAWELPNLAQEKAGMYRLTVQAKLQSAAKPQKKRSKRMSAIKDHVLGQEVFEWHCLPSNVASISTKMLGESGSAIDLDKDATTVLQIEWLDKYKNRCFPHTHPDLRSEDEKFWKPTVAQGANELAEAKHYRLAPAKSEGVYVCVLACASIAKATGSMSLKVFSQMPPIKGPFRKRTKKKVLASTVELTVRMGEPVALKLTHADTLWTMENDGKYTLPALQLVDSKGQSVREEFKLMVIFDNLRVQTFKITANQETIAPRPLCFGSVGDKHVLLVAVKKIKGSIELEKALQSKTEDASAAIACFLKSRQEVDPIEMTLTVKPSRQPRAIRLTAPADDLNKALDVSYTVHDLPKSRKEWPESAAVIERIVHVGQQVSNLSIDILDEAGQACQTLDYDAISVNPMPDSGFDTSAFKERMIPNLPGSNQADVTKYTIVIPTQSIKPQFAELPIIIRVIAIVGKPEHMKAHFSHKAKTIAAGVPSGLPLLLSMTDASGNSVSACEVFKRLQNSLVIRVKDVDAKFASIKVEDNVRVAVHGLMLPMKASTTRVSLSIECGGMQTKEKVTIVAGPPQGVLFPEAPIIDGAPTISATLDTSFKIKAMVVDAFGSKCAGEKGSLQLKVDASSKQAKLVNKCQTAFGKASTVVFNDVKLKGKPAVCRLNVNVCTKGAGKAKGSTINLGHVVVKLEHDQLRLAKIQLATEQKQQKQRPWGYNAETEEFKPLVLRAGDSFPTLRLSLLNSNGDVIDPLKWCNSRKGKVTSELCQQKPKEKIPLKIKMSDTVEQSCNKEFTSVGEYMLAMLFTEDNVKRVKEVIPVHVKCGKPVRLSTNAKVENLAANKEGVLLKRLDVHVEDAFGNMIPDKWSLAALQVKLKEKHGPSFDVQPLDGPEHVKALSIELHLDSKAKSGTYHLLVAPQNKMDIQPLILPFAFTNDQKTRQKISQLQSKIEKLESKMETAEGIISQVDTSVNESKTDFKHAKSKIEAILTGGNLQSLAGVDLDELDRARLEEAIASQKDALSHAPQEGLPSNIEQRSTRVQGEVGVIGHFLAVHSSSVLGRATDLQCMVSWAAQSITNTVLFENDVAMKKGRAKSALSLKAVFDKEVTKNMKMVQDYSKNAAPYGGQPLQTVLKVDRTKCTEAEADMLERAIGFSLPVTLIFREEAQFLEYRAKRAQRQQRTATAYMLDTHKVASSSGILTKRDMPHPSKLPMVSVYDKHKKALQHSLDLLEQAILHIDDLVTARETFEDAQQATLKEDYITAQADFNKWDAKLQELRKGLGVLSADHLM
eukprot:TRINITY_DN12379_c0_g1_i4.p1 TRINITY_DN12379_c0_g1~~TRINITY_DN12379_c0_g1_i4.p1  ORF type:complete len:1811 (+),score=427.35 TRINITY_DN12379_c0_g1_i4:22-5454(+)